MPAVFVHGNPETAAIWDQLFEQLGRDDVIALSPPGFGVALPESFAATSDAYLEWLSGELEAINGPIDLVGHDWGGGHVMRVAMSRPDLVRSWAMDIAGCFDPEYVWHDAAQTWQTEGAGEESVAEMVGAPVEARTELFASFGMGPTVAAALATAANKDMGRAILSLYRSAAQPAMSVLGEQLPKAAAKPGLVIIATEDHYTGGEVLAKRSAKRAGAEVAVLDGLGHWWMCENPQLGAETLAAFWSKLS